MNVKPLLLFSALFFALDLVFVHLLVSIFKKRLKVEVFRIILITICSMDKDGG